MYQVTVSVSYHVPRRDSTRDDIRRKVAWGLSRFDRRYPGSRQEDQTKVWFSWLGLFNPLTTYEVQIRVVCYCNGEEEVRRMSQQVKDDIAFHFKYE